LASIIKHVVAFRSGKSHGNGLGIVAAVQQQKTNPGERKMRLALKVLGGVLVLLGTVWFLQGINVLPGSFMTGQMRWAVYGGIAVVAGIALLVVASRRRTRP
jgi:uncharacterized membrane protein HdeD (DUF308 family)